MADITISEVDVGGTKVSYSLSGRGVESVILLHGSAGSKAHWNEIRQRLERRYRVIVPDLFGYGRSEARRSGAASLSEEATLVSALIDRCAGPVHLVGHSYGGAVALRTALERGQDLSSLVLIEPVAFHLLRAGGPFEYELFREIGEVAASVSRAATDDDSGDGMACFVDFWNGEGTWARIHPEIRAAVAGYAGKIGQDFRVTMNEPVPLTAYSLISAPTRILCGETSHSSTAAIAGLLTGALPNADLETVAAAGHMMPLTHPEPVAAAITAHVADSVLDRPMAA